MIDKGFEIAILIDVVLICISLMITALEISLHTCQNGYCQEDKNRC